MDDLKLEQGIAIISMAGRFPGAKNIEQFWENLKQGVESVRFFSDEELLNAGITSDLIKQPNYVKAKACLDDIDYFDADFFNFSPKEAAITDPQQRLFLECAWQALETAGYNVKTYKGDIGVYAGCSANQYYYLPDADPVANYQATIGNEKDFLCTRISYKLNLTGPSFTVQTACSTSLVAINVACQALLDYQCDMALSGGVSISLPNKAGYLYHEGMILSPDGHCRAFDINAKGIVHGDGVGIVVLKRLQDALDDGDSIHAVICGGALNNDGSEKVGYTAPSVTAQAKVIAEALAVAEIPAETIGYVEAHGTGTKLGDPIEIAALTQAYHADTQQKNYCAIGSVKTNIGHLDAAAGVAGLIKTVLSLKNKQLVPSLHFTQANPKLDLANSPFYVNTQLQDWASNTPRRAAVSSFGIGGTNAHLVLEQAPELISSSSIRTYKLLILSARTESALQAQQQQLADYLQTHPDINLHDVAYTLQIGRQAFAYRSIVVCESLQDAINKLKQPVINYHLQTEYVPSVVFMFPGQGAQYVNMGLDLYKTESVFQEAIDECSEFLQPHLELDLRQILYPTPEQTEYATQQLTQTAITQPALFIIEYALSKLWMSWGIQPQAMIGHSIGEYVAACLAGVFCVEDALILVAERGRLMQSVETGSMLAVSLSESELKSLLPDNIDIAAINMPNQTVVSGTNAAIDAFAQQLQTQDIETKRLHTSHAFHSDMMSAILSEFAQVLQNVYFHSPHTLFISNLTGQWISADEVINPDYWVQHLRHTVRFAQGLKQLFDAFNHIVLLEVGPGHTLSQFAKHYNSDFCLPSLRHVRANIDDNQFIQQTLGQLWLADVAIDWQQFYAQEQRLRIPLPTYPFERKRYWLEQNKFCTPVRDSSKEANQKINVSLPKSSEHFTVEQKKLIQIWQQILGVQQINLEDDFFVLGGNSLMAVQLINIINKELQQNLSSHILLDAPTISQLLKRLDIGENLQQERPFCLVEIQKGNPNKLPLFLVHPVGGHVYIYRDLAKSLGAEQPVYGLQSIALDGKSAAQETIEQMASDYIQAIQTVQSTGPYLLGGASFGGVVAYEMAQQLQQADESIKLLTMFDTPDLSASQFFELDDVTLLLSFLALEDKSIDLPIHWQQLSQAEQLDYIAQSSQIDYFSDTINMQASLQIVKKNVQAMQNYSLKSYQGKIIYFKAIERNPAYDMAHPEYGWIDVALQGIEIYPVSGGHVTMHNMMNVKVIAKILMRFI